MQKKIKVLFWIAIFLICLTHIILSSYRLPERFEDEPGAGAFGGIRLYYLNPWKLDFSKGIPAAGGGSHILDNFIKSAVSGQHGMIDYLHWYLYIAVYNTLGIPLNEFWFLFAQTLVMASGLVVLCLLFAKLYDSKFVAFLFLLIAAQLFMKYSRSFYIIPPNTLMEGLLLWALYLYAKKGSTLFLNIALFLLLFANAVSGNLIKLPVYVFFVWCVSYKYYGLGPARFVRETIIRKPSNLIFVVPVLLALAGHLYVFSRLGQSHLGMFGWISQKFGAGGAVSRFSMLNQVFEKMLFQKSADWWVIGLLFLFYVIAAKRAGRSAPLFFFPLIYYVYLINTEPNGALLPFVMILSLGIYGMFSLTSGVMETSRRTLCRVFSVLLALYFIINLTSLTVYAVAIRREPPPNYLKAAGFFLREHMRPGDKIASLLDEKHNILNEYYYGKNYFKSPVFGKYIYDLRNLTEPESSSNPVSAEERKTDFAFYVISAVSYFKSKNYAVLADSMIKERLLRKVADIFDGGKVYVAVYSARPIKFEKIEIKRACAEFDRKYANIKMLFANHHVGVASTWGFY